MHCTDMFGLGLLIYMYYFLHLNMCYEEGETSKGSVESLM